MSRSVAKNSEADDALDHFEYELVRIGQEIEDVVKAAKVHEDVILLQLYSAAFYLYAQTKEGNQKALFYLSKAKKLLAFSSTEERSLYRCLLLWATGELLEALKAFEKHCSSYPENIASLKLAEFLYYCSGQKHLSRRFLNLTQKSYDRNKDKAHYLSMHSFALELNGYYERSRKSAEKSLELDSQNPWGYHTLSHYYLNKGKIDDGIQVLNRGLECFKNANRAIESHDLWHLALLHLENLDFKGVFDVYKRADWENKASQVGEEVDAAALLWRLDMHDQDLSPLWETLANSIEDRAEYPITPFASAQLCYALKKGKRYSCLEKAMSRVKAMLLKKNSPQYDIWKTGVELVNASLVFAEKDYKQAAKLIKPIFTKIGSCGGSDAQIDLFYQMYLVSLLKTGKKSSAKQVFKKLSHPKIISPREELLFYDALS